MPLVLKDRLQGSLLIHYPPGCGRDGDSSSDDQDERHLGVAYSVLWVRRCCEVHGVGDMSPGITPT